VRQVKPVSELMLTELLRQRAEDEPDAIAIQEVTGRTLTWAQAFEDSLCWAEALRRVGLDAGATVASMLPNCADAYFCWLGVARLSAIEAPINTSYKGRMLEYMVENSTARVLVVAERFLSQLVDIADRLTHVEVVVVPDAVGELPALPFRVVARTEFLDGVAPDHSLARLQPHDIATMIYTSGTTGPSKGVLVPWAELFAFVDHAAPGMVPEHGAYYSTYPPFHISGKSALYNAVLYNARLVLREGFSARNFWSDVRAFDCTSVMLVGPLAAILLAAPPQPDDADNPLQNVSLGPLPADLDGFKKRFGVRVSTAYGTTEIGLPLGSGWDIPNSRTCGQVKPGYPGYEARVVDEHDQPLGPGQVGELVIRSDAPWALCAGYYGMPDKTAEAWRNGWFHTGDAFMIDEDGWFYFVDRLKDTIRRRGENISSFEVEACVNDHPAVAESVALAVPSELGEDEILVVVRLQTDQSLTPAELVAFLDEHAPGFMVPRYVEFIDEFPKTDATQRVRKVELRKRGISAATWDRERT
jgi:crotonobetaine/carnitine-CoA ligase